MAVPLINGMTSFFAGLVVLLLGATQSVNREALIDGSVLALATAMVLWISIIEPSTEPVPFREQPTHQPRRT